MKKVYEVVFPGFDGSTSDTDHLIVWIEADTLETVEDFLSDIFYEGINMTPYTTEDKCADLTI